MAKKFVISDCKTCHCDIRLRVGCESFDLGKPGIHPNCPLENDNTELMLSALEEISEGKGRYDLDHLQHVINCVEDMVDVAKETIKKVKGE